jgi:anti-repressor protein
MSNLIPFNFKGHDIRVIVDDNGEPWFVAMDVAEILGYSDTNKMTSKLDLDEVQNRQISGFGNRGVNLINESGLYSCILTSKKREAKAFKKWLTGEVIPSIRKTGSYSVKPVFDPMAALNDPATMRGLLLDYCDQLIQKQAQIEALEPKANAFDRLDESEGSMCPRYAAKVLKIKPKELFNWLHVNRWIYRNGDGKWIGYQTHIDRGLLEQKITTFLRTNGSTKNVEQVLITSKGITKLAQLLNNKDSLLSGKASEEQYTPAANDKDRFVELRLQINC